MLYAKTSKYINSQTLHGYATPGTTVRVTDENNNLVGTSDTVGKDWTWSIPLDDAHLFTTTGQTQTFTATDVSSTGQTDPFFAAGPVKVTYTTVKPIIKVANIITLSVSDAPLNAFVGGEIRIDGTIDDTNGSAPVSTDWSYPISIKFGNYYLGNVSVNADKTWSAHLSLRGSGTYEFTTSVEDQAGNIGSALVSYTLTTTQTFDFKFSDAHLSANAKGITVSGPDGLHQGIPGMTHYKFSDGTVDLKSSSPLIDNLFYYYKYSDAWRAHADPLKHYYQYGWHENRDPNDFFSTAGYLAANADVAKNGINPLNHFDRFGWKEGRDPGANFDTDLYLLHNPDVKADGMDPLAHYLQHGKDEGRQTYSAIGKASDFIHGSFDPEYYLLANPDVAKAALQSGKDTFAFAYQHYSSEGWQGGRMGNAYFDSTYYLAHYQDVAAAHMDPLAHYDQFGWKEGRNPGPSFDTSTYLAANADVAAAHIDPLLHYLQYGALEGRHLA